MYICRYCRQEEKNNVMDLVNHLAVRHNELKTPSKALFYYEINGKSQTFRDQTNANKYKGNK